MKIAFCCSEAVPFAKTGGMADVCGALPKALAEKGHQVMVFLPWYQGIRVDSQTAHYGTVQKDSVTFCFIRNDHFFFRAGLYGSVTGDYHDNFERFYFFCREILRTLKECDFSPDIVHCNDWQTALIPVLLKLVYGRDPLFVHTKTVLTIHNLAYQGVFHKDKFNQLGIPWKYFTMHCLEFYDQINVLKGGIVFADIINTVSPTYAQQIQTSQYGESLDGMLRERHKKLFGILNAVDYTIWNPQKDLCLEQPYSVKTVTDKKAQNKAALQKSLGLKVADDMFLLAIVGRLAEQKGIDILLKALPSLVKQYQIVILGKGDDRLGVLLRDLSRRYAKRLSVHIGFDEKAAHQIYAGCDALLMPSRFEPCGLSQLIAYKYGTIPIVYYTGGLVDTVIDYSRDGGGFVFYEYSPDQLLVAVRRAAAVFSHKPEWEKIVKKVMHYNYSWEKTATQYQKLYEKVCS